MTDTRRWCHWDWLLWLPADTLRYISGKSCISVDFLRRCPFGFNYLQLLLTEQREIQVYVIRCVFCSISISHSFPSVIIELTPRKQCHWDHKLPCHPGFYLPTFCKSFRSRRFRNFINSFSGTFWTRYVRFCPRRIRRWRSGQLCSTQLFSPVFPYFPGWYWTLMSEASPEIVLYARPNFRWHIWSISNYLAV